MDLNTLHTSHIKKSDELYSIALPNFFGYAEGVYYSHEGKIIDSIRHTFSHVVDLDEMTDSVNQIFLMSRVCGSLLIRVIDTEDSSSEKIILAKSAKFISFKIRKDTYFGILSYSIEGNLELTTNFLADAIMTSTFEHGLWTITNTLTGTTLYQFSFPYETNDSNHFDTNTGMSKVEFYLIGDPLFPEKQEKNRIEDILHSIKKNRERDALWKIEHEKLNGNISKISLCTNTNNIKSELRKLLGIIGNHLVITEEKNTLEKYLSLEEATKMDIELDGTFNDQNITLYDPKWHQLRLSLVSLSYLLYYLETHIHLLEGSLESLDSLNHSSIRAQKYRSKITLENLEKTKNTYTNILNSLIKSLKQNNLLP